MDTNKEQAKLWIRRVHENRFVRIEDVESDLIELKEYVEERLQGVQSDIARRNRERFSRERGL